MGGACGTYGRGVKAYEVLVRNPEGKRPLGRPRRSCENGIRINLRETGRGVWNRYTWLRIGTTGGLL
jgi:hypothetical protein